MEIPQIVSELEDRIETLDDLITATGGHQNRRALRARLQGKREAYKSMIRWIRKNY